MHSDFVPADRHKGTLPSPRLQPPKSQNYPADQEAPRPRWVRDQRNSWHGVDYPYNTTLDITEYYQRYAETLRGVDDSIGTVLDYLKAEGLLDSTLVIYMGDNGSAFGEHGLIDKRTAYEESMRVPMIMQCPELLAGGGGVEGVVANLDIAPTILSAVGFGVGWGRIRPATMLEERLLSRREYPEQHAQYPRDPASARDGEGGQTIKMWARHGYGPPAGPSPRG